jgi:hypothetical protein
MSHGRRPEMELEAGVFATPLAIVPPVAPVANPLPVPFAVKLPPAVLKPIEFVWPSAATELSLGAVTEASGVPYEAEAVAVSLNEAVLPGPASAVPKALTVAKVEVAPVESMLTRELPVLSSVDAASPLPETELDALAFAKPLVIAPPVVPVADPLAVPLAVKLPPAALVPVEWVVPTAATEPSLPPEAVPNDELLAVAVPTPEFEAVACEPAWAESD